jgi:hypothetical protein
MEAHSDHNPLSAGDARASTCSFFIVEFRMKVVKFVKMKPHEVALLELLSFYALHCLLASHQGSQSGVIPNSRVSMLVVLLSTVTPGFKAKPDAHRMYAQDQVVIHTVRM